MMALFNSFVVLLLLQFACFSSAQEDYTDCHTQKSVLLKALFNIENNRNELDRVFFPARVETSRYIKVTYVFLESDGSPGTCNVTYFWAIGGFLLMQPPSIFRLTSLLFNNPANDLMELSLMLPYECRKLIEEDNEVCMCPNYTTALSRMTQQVL